MSDVKIRVLLAERKTGWLEVIAEGLANRTDVTLFLWSRSAQGLRERLLENPPQVAVLAWGRFGPGLLEAIRDAAPEAAVVILVGAQGRSAAGNAGADLVLEKPGGLRKVLNDLDRFLDELARKRELAQC